MTQTPAPVQITSDGTPNGTFVTVAGVLIDDVVGVTWSIGHDRLAVARVTLERVAVDVTAPSAPVDVTS